MTGDRAAGLRPHRRRQRAGRAAAFACLTALLFMGVAPPRAGAAILATHVRVDPDVVLRGEPATVTVSVDTDGFQGAEIVAPSAPGITLQRVGTSQNLSMGAGRVVRTDVAIFQATADLVGTQTIPPFKIVHDRRTTETTATTFTTVASLPSGGGAAGGEKEKSSPLFARIVADRRRVFWNEQIVARIQIFARAPLEDMPTWDPPDAAGFWGEPLGDARHGRVTLNGTTYEVYERIVAFFPTRPGRLTLGPARARVRVLQRLSPSYDPLGGLFPAPPAEVIEVPVEAAPVDIAVDPLPAGAPPGFRGAVGRLELGVRVDRRSVRVGEPISVATTIRGEGNLASAGDPDIAARPVTPSYPTGARTDLDRNGERLRGSRRREIAFVPDHAGSLLVLPIEFSWFDPEEGRYRVQRSDTIAVRVNPPAPGSEGARGEAATTAIGVLAPPRSPGTPTATWLAGRLDGWPPALPLAAGLVSLAGYLGFAGAAAKRRTASRDPRWRRAKWAEEAARRVEEAARERDPARAAERTETALRDAAGIRFGIDAEGRSRRDLIERLRAAEFPEEDVNRLRDLLGRLERGAFAPGAAEDVARALSEAAALAARWRDECRP